MYNEELDLVIAFEYEEKASTGILMTTCKLLSGEKLKEAKEKKLPIEKLQGHIYTGHAFKVPSDPHCKAIGRKIALTRALESFDRNDRKKMWDTYLQRKG